MKYLNLASSMATVFCLGVAGPVLSAETPPAAAPNVQSPGAKGVFAPQPAEACLNDLSAFDRQMEKDGYWFGGSGYAYGYPMFGYSDGIGYGDIGERSGYRNARPGYEIRTLVAAANILARKGQQQPCEDLLTETRALYTVYVSDMQNGRVPAVDIPVWRQRQIASAQTVTSTTTAFRSDELVGADVRNPQNEALGSVTDLVMSPQTGKIAYLVIGRGGIFGIDETYVPVPWQDFKITHDRKMLVLDTTKLALESAPHVNYEQFAIPGHFDEQSQKVDAYWTQSFAKHAAN